MAKIFNPNKRGKHRAAKSSRKQLAYFDTVIENYDHELKGIGKGPDNRIAFVAGAMEGESVRVKPTHYTDRMILAEPLERKNSHKKRIEAKCQHFQQCGGCQLQYMSASEQLHQKQAALDKLIKKHLGLSELPWQAAISEDEWHYRRTARLALWHKGASNSQIGFRQKGQKEIVDISDCPILVPELNTLVQRFRNCLQQLIGRKDCTHLSVFAVDSGNYLLLRATKELQQTDLELLNHFSTENDCNVLVENNDNQTFDVKSSDNSVNILLEYQLVQLKFQFQSADFIQINAKVNKAMVKQALQWLDLNSSDTVLDLFSGVGNFTLPLAKQVEKVIAVEGVSKMVARLNANAQLNGLNNVRAHQADLSQFDDKRPPKWLSKIDKLLLDPARDGALAVVNKIPKLSPSQILYVSCNPVTMARDMKVLLDADYRLTKLGLVNMFPHTSHTEAMALLQRQRK